MPTAKRTDAASTAPKIHLIQSDDTEPSLKLKPGMKFEVRATTITDPELKPIKKVASRLCGGTNTCLALVEL
ncbi:conserved hypothetical protein [Mesorhizobium prunaredense]|uniref:Uncharacterized protein n=1 Tax=Mesorhizobium prunaredense TaxID=1631249 RepID=A0A1R3V8C9_9HYPH|nr:hypothetical protein [Mesorhizobium prunaredense]SIT56159.1 conserved hypothetical protein [Mesorhizobium prunaredense]